MNAAARLVQQRVLSYRFSFSFFFNKKQWLLMALGLMVLISALSLIYTTYMTRALYAHFQQQTMEKNALQMMQAQLLLERSTILMQAKTQQFAESKLNMVIPDFKSIIVVHE